MTVRASDAYARLRRTGIPVVVETSDVAGILRVKTSTATMLLGRLAGAGLVMRLRPGQWLVAVDAPNRYALLEYVTAPFPSYISFHTALYLHGMIDQVPAVVYAASLSRTRRIRTSIGDYSLHHIAPELFDGFETRSDGAKVATPEKALFDFIYLSGGRSHLFARIPELELPKRFRRSKLREWSTRIATDRRRTMVESRLEAALAKR